MNPSTLQLQFCHISIQQNIADLTKQINVQQTSVKNGTVSVTGSPLIVFFITVSFFPPCHKTSWNNKEQLISHTL